MQEIIPVPNQQSVAREGRAKAILVSIVIATTIIVAAAYLNKKDYTDLSMVTAMFGIIACVAPPAIWKYYR